jgi:hypothetical protein
LDRRIAHLHRDTDGTFSLKSSQFGEYKFSRSVDGKLLPFSIQVTKGAVPVLKIRERIFSHKGATYIISNVPESKSRESYLRGPKYISKLENYDPQDPASTVRSERRLRGTHVGEISGIGSSGHRVVIDASELSDVALLLAAASFLINTTHGDSRNDTSRLTMKNSS